jgi:uncharacterized protein (DUF2062 family)
MLNRVNQHKPRVLAALVSFSRELWERAKREPSSPREIAFSVAVGAFSACTPFLGFHLGIAVTLATLLRLNRPWAMIASRTPPPLFLVITFVEIELAHRLRTGRWAPIELHGALARAHELAIDWAVGTFIVGVPFAALLGLTAWAIAHRWQRLNPRTPAAVRRPSSEFPT